jgi:Phosphotransferase enzyme family
MSGGYRDILNALVPAYGLAEDAYCEPLGHGLINQTLLLHSGDKRFVAQRINREVFPNPGDLVANACLVEQQLRESSGYPLQVTHHLADSRGRYLHGQEKNIRLMAYVEDSVSLEVDPSPIQAESAAAAYGQFNLCLSELDASRLNTVIPDFHHLDHRLEQFFTALAQDRAGRATSCQAEINSYSSQHELAQQWRRAVKELPLRVCHNDTKLNNLLVHVNSGEPLAVIDLDTCMAGHLMTEFGDMVRTSTSPEPEDSTQLDKVHARPEILSALTRGYLRGLAELPDAKERRSLALGARLMPFIIGLRFVTDYLNGDHYFKTRYQDHNLDRARNQFALYCSLCEARESLEQLLETA